MDDDDDVREELIKCSNEILSKNQKNPWNSFLGDCSVIDQYLLDKPVWSIKWFIPNYLNVLLRAAGQPALVNNPLCGLIIVIATFLSDWKVGVGMILGGSIATIGEMIFGFQPWALMRNGVAPFNGILVGTVTSVLYPAFYKLNEMQLDEAYDLTLKMWIFICLGSFASILFSAAFENTLGKVGIPYFALPFCTIATCTFYTIKPHDFGETLGNNSTDTTQLSSNQTENIDWCGVGKGVLLSMGQVYAINDIKTSSLMNLAVFLASPLLFIVSSIGALLGTLAGVALLPFEELPEVYDGVWGFNAILASASVMCVFFACNPASLFLGAFNLACVICAQYALRATMTVEHSVPVFTLPFTLVTQVIINVGGFRGYLYRVEDMSYPEKQAYDWYTRIRVKTQDEDEPKNEDNKETI